MSTRKRNPLTTSLIHEINERGQHRILHIRNGVPCLSRWFEAHQIAVYGKFRATVPGVFGEALPSGVFTVTPQECEVM